MTPHEKLNFIQNIVYELLEGEAGHEAFIDDLANTKSQLQEILYVIERITPTHSDDLDTVVDDFKGVGSTKTQYHVFCGDDEDYGYPYAHRYHEPNSDRGASDEGWEDEDSVHGI